MTRILIICALLALVTGCASKQPMIDSGAADLVDEQIASSLGRIASAYEQLALIQSATKNKQLNTQTYQYDEKRLPGHWLQEINLLEDYHGDLGRFISMISVMGGLKEPRFDVKGSGRPLLVSVKSGKRKLIGYLADVGYQAGDSAMISPDVNLNKVVVIFKE